MPQVKYIDFFPYSPGDPVNGLRLCEIGGAFFLTADGVTFTAVGGAAPTEYYASLTAGAATSLTLSGLNGDADGDYLIRMYIKSVAVAANTIKIQVNGADTNLYCTCSDPIHGGVAVNSSWTIAVAGLNPYTFATGNWCNLLGVFPARSGRKRLWNASGFAQIQAANNAITLNGEYGDTSTNLTSISIVGSVAAGLSSECFILATRILSTNPLA